MPEKYEEMVSSSSAATGDNWINPANMLTALRGVLAPPIIALLVYQPQGFSWSFAAGSIFVLAALTDKADGYYARKYDSVTSVGEFLDPLADKLLMIPIMVAMAFVSVGPVKELMPLWVVGIVIARELMISVIRLVGARRGISFPASWSGKVKMFSQVVVVSIILFFPSSAGGIPVLVLVYTMAAITVYSGIDYLFRARREIFNRPAGGTGSP